MTTTLLITFCCCEWFCRRETTSRQRTSFCLKVKQELSVSTETSQQPMVLPWFTKDPIVQSPSHFGALQCLALFRCPNQGHTIIFLVFPPLQKSYIPKFGGETDKEKPKFVVEDNKRTYVSNFSGTFGPNSEFQQGLICDFELCGSLRLLFLQEENPTPPQVPPVPTETRRSYRQRSYVLCLL